MVIRSCTPWSHFSIQNFLHFFVYYVHEGSEGVCRVFTFEGVYRVFTFEGVYRVFTFEGVCRVYTLRVYVRYIL